MEKNTYLDSIDFKSINVVIAVLSGLVTIALAFAPNTVSALLKIEYSVQTTASWFNSSRVLWITSLSITLLALWARYINEVYAQKILLKFAYQINLVYNNSKKLKGDKYYVKNKQCLPRFSMQNFRRRYIFSSVAWR